ncbi:protein of unknown function [Methylacidimicrobium sp. AP8]|nr:protein of unknown function [Methylacidimicrobium sp. AP8]
MCLRLAFGEERAAISRNSGPTRVSLPEGLVHQLTSRAYCGRSLMRGELPLREGRRLLKLPARAGRRIAQSPEAEVRSSAAYPLTLTGRLISLHAPGRSFVNENPTKLSPKCNR